MNVMNIVLKKWEVNQNIYLVYESRDNLKCLNNYVFLGVQYVYIF